MMRLKEVLVHQNMILVVADHEKPRVETCYEADIVVATEEGAFDGC